MTMRNITLGKSALSVPTVAVGCMRITALSVSGASRFIGTAIENGANFFDHADIYGGGRSEKLFAQAYGMTDDKREKIILQSKCGIDRGLYDFSKEHILTAVDGILSRLNTDYLDVLLLHRPDALCEPEEVAEAFDALKSSGKVRNFGVSNHNPGQIALLSKYLHTPIVANQMQLSIAFCGMISEGINVNNENDRACVRDGGILDYCRLNDITIQPWSPFQYGFFEGSFVDNEKFPALNKKLDELAEKYGVSKNTIVIAWLLRHPAHFMPVTGTTKVERLLDCLKAADITLTRDEWYDVYKSAGNILP